MKLFSRKALAAVATTAALTVSGMTAPAFAEEAPANPEVHNSQETTEDDNTGSEGKNPGTEDDDTPAPAPADDASSFGGSSEDLEAKEIREWIGVFTAIIGALSTVFVFAQRIM